MKLGQRLLCLWLLVPLLASAQIDPARRDLVQFGYNQAFQGHVPLAGYAYYYHNQPNFLQTNLTLRLAVAPVYLDSEFGFVNGIGPNTDFGLGVAGGGFADSYNEIHGGTYFPSQSFEGNGAEISASLYHLFNPASLIPLNYVLRGKTHYASYNRTGETASDFQLPNDHTEFSVRTGLRWGGVEPTLFPPLAMELSVWYEGAFRTDPGAYGIDHAYELEQQSHLFWSEAALAYTLPKSQQSFYVRLTAGTSVDADHFSAYRLGGFLPLISEFPLSLPGYYFQEISARQFVLLNANYLLPLNPRKTWSLDLNASTAIVDYLPGEGQPGNTLTGVGGGILYHTPSQRLKLMVSYAYGIDAIRAAGRGASSIGVLMQIDLGWMHSQKFSQPQPVPLHGWQRFFD
ncbi:MAG TPA: hypothetical protein VNN22_20965 [Verrucomicrobiae bacterium]|nr:hypothetical protein [Verrucomicrobiae bacterium]